MIKKLLLIGVIAMWLGGLLRADDPGDALAIIVNKKCTIDNIPSADIVKYFREEKVRDADGNKVTVLMREHGSAERAAVLRHIYQMTEQEYQTYFLQATFTGAVTAAPKKLNSAASVRQFVSDSVGAIGYIRLRDVNDTVKVLKIDGKSPGDDGYILKIK